MTARARALAIIEPRWYHNRVIGLGYGTMIACRLQGEIGMSLGNAIGVPLRLYVCLINDQPVWTH